MTVNPLLSNPAPHWVIAVVILCEDIYWPLIPLEDCQYQSIKEQCTCIELKAEAAYWSASAPEKFEVLKESEPIAAAYQFSEEISVKKAHLDLISDQL